MIELPAALKRFITGLFAGSTVQTPPRTIQYVGTVQSPSPTGVVHRAGDIEDIA